MARAGISTSCARLNYVTFFHDCLKPKDGSCVPLNFLTALYYLEPGDGLCARLDFFAFAFNCLEPGDGSLTKSQKRVTNINRIANYE